MDSKSTFVIGSDTGGTFTDITVLTDQGEIFMDKAPTTPHDFSIGVMDAIDKVSQGMGLTREDLLRRSVMVKHGSTVATNALITREGSKVGLISTRGFEDTTLIMRAIGRGAGLRAEEVKQQAPAGKTRAHGGAGTHQGSYGTCGLPGESRDPRERGRDPRSLAQPGRRAPGSGNCGKPSLRVLE